MTRRTFTRTIRLFVGDVLEGKPVHQAHRTTSERIKVLFITAQTLVCRDMQSGRESEWTLAHRDWRIVRRGGKPFRDDGRSAR